jgi:hypothetical protein
MANKNTIIENEDIMDDELELVDTWYAGDNNTDDFDEDKFNSQILKGNLSNIELELILLDEYDNDFGDDDEWA